MLEFIVNASSNENSIVMDCFCGSGSTLMAAERNGRNWIGIDSSEVAINIVKSRKWTKEISFIQCEGITRLLNRPNTKQTGN